MRFAASLAGLVLTFAAVGEGQNPRPTQGPVGAVERRFTPQPYNWRGAETQALTTTIWYPTTAGLSETDHFIGSPADPLFILGRWTDRAPVAPGRFPLILLSHGTGGSAEIMAWLGRGLASRGYVVAAVNHPGNNALEPYTAEGFLLWWERGRDLTTVLDFILDDDTLAQHIDPRRIGATGFSLGGYTMFVLAGARTDPARFQEFCRSSQAAGCADPPEFPNLQARWAELRDGNAAFRGSEQAAGGSFRDERVRAVFAIAPALGPALVPESVRQIDVPVHIVAGEDDQIAPLRTNGRALSALVPRSTLSVLPAGHYTFLATCTAAGRRAQPLLCEDPPAVDREFIHRQAVDLVADFFSRTLN